MISRLFLSLTIISAPFYVFRGIIPSPFVNILIPTTLLEILIIVSLIFSIFDFLKSKKSIEVLRTKFDFLILSFLLISFISVFFSKDSIGGFGIFRAYFLEPILFYYMLVYQVRKNGYNFVINSLLLSGFILSVIALIQKFTGQFVFAPQELQQGRISAVYNSANSLALYLGPISILSFSLFLKFKNNRRFIYLVVFLLNFLVILWTKSRGGFIAEISSILILVYCLLSIKFSELRKLWMIIPITLLILTSYFFIYVYQTYSNYPTNIALKSVRGDTLHIRFLIWESTAEMIKDKPLFGFGLNGFKDAYDKIYRSSIFPEEFQYPHNLFLTFWVETGFLGMLIFLLLIYKIYSNLLRNFLRSNNIHLFAGLIALFSYWLIHGIVDVPYFKNDLSLEFWISVALVSGYLKN